MTLSHFRPVALSLALLLIFSSTLRADQIPWTYSWSNSPTEIQADSPGTGTIALVNPGSGSPLGDTDIVATNLKTASTASKANPDVFTAKTYALVLTLTDVASGASGSLTFTGQIDGKVWSGSSQLKNTFTGLTTQHLDFANGNTYTVTLSSYLPPGDPTAGTLGGLGGQASITVSHVIVQSVPEPGTLALSLLGLAACGAGSRWRLRRGRRAIQ